jgi:peroxin-19
LNAATAVGGGLDDEDFAQQLQAGMADLLGELESSPEMQRQFEDMLRELGAAGAVAPGGAAGVGGASPAATTDGVTAGAARDVAAAAEGGAGAGPPLSFQESIQRTMERMQESGDAAGAAAASSGQGEADFLAAMLREMESGGEGSDEDFSKMLLGMMEQLTNKDILYEPMKELDNKFPDWMEKNGSTVPEADMKRYETQQKLVREIIQKFEEPGYTDENVDSRKYIVDRMQQVRH